MRRHFVSGFPRALLSLGQEKSSGVEIGRLEKGGGLRMVRAKTVNKNRKQKKKKNKKQKNISCFLPIFRYLLCINEFLVFGILFV